MSLTNDFAELFASRDFVYGSDSGGAVRTDLDWQGIVAQHLESEGVGGYPMVPTGGRWLVKWGCVDFDVQSPGHKNFDFLTTEDALDAADDLIAVLHHLDVEGWAEITRSGGVHVWVFSSYWLPAKTMRRALLVASNVARTPTTEVNPKSESFDDPDALGNYVRLPYPLWNANANRFGRRVIYVEGEVVELDAFLRQALARRSSPTTFVNIALLYREPRHVTAINDDFEPPELDEPLRRRMSGLAWTIFRDGPLENQDRSGALYRLAALLADDDMTPEEALTIVTAADAAWGKYYGRRNGNNLLRKLVTAAYG